MADEERFVKIKKEKQDSSSTSKPTPTTTSSVVNLNNNNSNTNPRPQIPHSHGQQKITQYFGNTNKNVAKKEEETEEGRKTPPVDLESVKGRFGWTTLGSVHVPFLLRGAQHFVSVRIIEGKLLKKFLRALPPDVYNCTYIKSYFITENEAKLLNEINSQHCDFQFGCELFTPKDLVVPLADAQQFYDFLETCYCRLVEPSSGSANRCGFIKLNGSIVPYVTREGAKYVPLSFVERELLAIKTNAEKLESWELSYLKFCCKVAGINSDILSNQSSGIICVDSLKNTDDRMYLEDDWWPDRNAKSLNTTSSDVSIPKSIFQLPTTTLTNEKEVTKNNKDESDTMTYSPSKSNPPVTVSPIVSGGLPSLGVGPWTSPQPFIFNNNQWWGPIASHLLPTFSTSAKSDMFVPTLIPSPSFNLEKLLQHMQTTSTATTTSSTSVFTNNNSINNVSKESNKETKKKDESTSKIRQPPPPLVKNNSHSSQNPFNYSNGSGKSNLSPRSSRLCEVINSKTNTSQISNAHNSSTSLSTSSQSPSSILLSTAERQNKNQRIYNDCCRTQQGNYAESRVVAPGIQQQNGVVKQTSPKPANPVPTVGGHVMNPFLARPPPPLVPMGSLSAYASSAYHSSSPYSRQSKTLLQEPCNYMNSLPTSMSSTSSSTSLQSGNYLNGPYLIPEPSFKQSADGRRAYKLQLLTIDGRDLPVINGQPYTYGSPHLVAVKDVVEILFPNTTPHRFQQMLSEVLGIKLYSSNRLQQEAYRNQSQSCSSSSSSSSSEDKCNSQFVLIQLEDLNNYMPHLKYIFSRMEPTRSDITSFLTDTISGYGHTPKRIRL